ncbi:hypothetical protein ACS0TY_001186 [Phlomoides rotata]
MMRKKLPGTDIVANPHINSKIHADPHVKGVRYKSWSYYTQWIEIFGKDRATGDNDVDPIDIVDGLDNCEDEQEGDNGDRGIPRNIEIDHELEDNSICTGSKDENKKLNDIMKQIPGLKIGDKLKICDEMVQNEKQLEFFLSLPFEEQEEYVCMLLDGRL